MEVGGGVSPRSGGTRGMLRNLPGALGVTLQEDNRMMLPFLMFAKQLYYLI